VQVLAAYEADHNRKTQIQDVLHSREYENLSIRSTAEHVRAYIKVQDGCNMFCSYCIIPYARGRVRSRRIADVEAEVRELAARGYREVVLTGIHLSSYGLDFKDDDKENLLGLIRRVHAIEGIERIRLGSLEPRIVTEEFARELGSMEKICPHFHLSLQSGCDATLSRMKRRYNAAEYREKCELLRKYFAHPALTTDVIVGFPMETEEEFEASFEFVRSIHFYETHIFKYSRRKGTKAADMDGQLSEAQKAVRSDKMLALHEIRATEYEEAMFGRKMEILLEEEIEVDGKSYYIGHSKEYVKIAVEKDGSCTVNDLIYVRADTFLKEHILLGKRCE
jgi:threonylcarbamoyladenosine tRNA methylthiotransferase MtaB